MVDITLRYMGDASGATQALKAVSTATKSSAEETAKATVKWQEYANAAKKAAGFVVEFTKDAVREWMEASRVQAQLQRVAGDYTDALSAQAEALKDLYAVDDDVIKQSETLLVQWGGVGAASKETEEAILDYAAATGKDAVTATQELIRNVETGGAGLAKLGVHFEATGDKGKDLAAAVKALGEKFGGAAETDAQTLSGQMKAAGLAADDAKKAFGALLGDMVEQSGVVPQLTEAFKVLAFAISDTGKADLEWQKLTGELRIAELEARNAKVAFDELVKAEGKGSKNPLIAEFEKDLKDAEARLDAVRAKLGIGLKAPVVTGRTAKGEKEKAEDPEKATLQATIDYAAKDLEIRKKAAEEVMKLKAEYSDRAAKAEEKEGADELQRREKQAADERAVLKKNAEEELDEFIKLQDEKKKLAAEAAKKLAEQQVEEARAWKQAGDAIGAAFVNALADQLSKLSEGEEFDVGEFIVSIISAAVSVAATAIGSAYGQPALGAAVGNIAALGIKAGYNAISAKSKKPTKQFHEGGYIGEDGLPRYHDGGYIGGPLAANEQLLVGLNGERVLSHKEINNMGGRASVETLARGGGGRSLQVNVSTIDAKGFTRLFTSDGDRGIRDALRTGQGLLPSLLGKSPR